MATKKRIKFFFLNGHLHKVLHIQRAQDLVTAYDFTEHRAKVYPWADVKRKMQNAFTITEAAKLVDRHRDRIVRYIREGEIKEPQREYNLNTKELYRYFFSEDDMMELHEYMASLHIGRPRNDGRVTNNRLPSREHMKALVKSQEILYVKDGEEYVPVWKEQVW